MSEPPVIYDPGSFRDPKGRVVLHQGEVYRFLNADGLRDWEHLAGSRFFARAQQEGSLAFSSRLSDSERVALPGGADTAGVLKHARIPFWSYPYEWSFEMLRDAALHHLQLHLAALDEGVTICDGTSFNIQFVGAKPVFIDLGSFRNFNSEPEWAGARQFNQMFLFPLLVWSRVGVAVNSWFRGAPEGLPVDVAARLLRCSMWRPSVFARVHLPALIDRLVSLDPADMPETVVASPSVLRRNLGQLQQLLIKLRPPRIATDFPDYGTYSHYSGEVTGKIDFVRNVASRRHWPMVWDLGANNGQFARVVSPYAGMVVAADSDAVTIDQLYLSLKADSGVNNILPLVLDLMNPSPGLGWGGVERQAFTNRGQPDLILFLAVIHHLVISRNLTVEQCLDWLAAFGCEIVLEFPTEQDEKVIDMLARHPSRRAEYVTANFMAVLDRHFTVLDRLDLLDGRRVLFHLRPKGTA